MEGLGHCILINMKYSSTELIISAAIIVCPAWARANR